MYSMCVTLKSGKENAIDFYSLDVAIDCAKDFLRAPDVANAMVISKVTGELVWEKGE